MHGNHTCTGFRPRRGVVAPAITLSAILASPFSPVACQTPAATNTDNASETPVVSQDTPDPSQQIDPTTGIWNGLSAQIVVTERQRDVPLPPGVQLGLLEAAADAHDIQHRTLESILSNAINHSETDTDGGVGSDPDGDVVAPANSERPVGDDVLRIYARGLDAALSGRHLVAVTEFRRAMEMDPGSPAVRRQLARTYGAMGNINASLEAYRSLRALKPNDGEALLTLGIAALDGDQLDVAADALARIALNPDIARFDPAAICVLHETLGHTLKSVGHDRACIEAWLTSLATLERARDTMLYQRRVNDVIERQDRILRDVGDAYCRLGDIEQAQRAWLIAEQFAAQTANNEQQRLLPRLTYASVVTGNDDDAQRRIIDAFRQSTQFTQGARGASSADAIDARTLTQWMHATGASTALLQREIQRLLAGQRDNLALLAAHASLLEDDERAINLMMFALRESPHRLLAIDAILQRAARNGNEALVDAALQLLDIEGVSEEQLIQRMVIATPSMSELLDVVPPSDASALQQLLHVRILMALNDFGEAWRQASRAPWTNDPRLLRCRVEIAALLGEPALLMPILETWRKTEDPRTLVTMATAARAVNETELAMVIAEAAANRLDQPAIALHEIARCHMKLAAERNNDQRQLHARDAAVYLERARDLAQSDDTVNPASALELLARLHANDGLLPDRTALDVVLSQLGALGPDHPFNLMMRAERALTRNRFDEAIRIGLRLHLIDPANLNGPAVASAGWRMSNTTEHGDRWFNVMRDHRPGDPILMQAHSQFLVETGRLNDAIAEVNAAVSRDDRDIAAANLLESLHRSNNDAAQAMALTQKRLRRLPSAPGRDVELAAILGGSGRMDDAVAVLDSIADNGHWATQEQLINAISVGGRIFADHSGAQDVVARLADVVTLRFSDTPMQVFGFGLLALHKLGRIDDDFDALADRAARMTMALDPANDPDIRNWIALADALVKQNAHRAAAAALRGRFRAQSDPDADWRINAFLFHSIVACDAASGDEQAPDRIEAFVEAFLDAGLSSNLSDRPTDTDPTEVWYQAAIVASTVGNDAAAARLYHRAIELNPNHALALNNLGYQQADAGDLSGQTVEFIERAFRLTPDSTSVLDTIGWLRYKQRRFEGDDGALSYIDRAIQVADQTSAEMHDHRGDILWRIGRKDDARTAWRAALNLLTEQGVREQSIRNYGLLQTRGWGLLVLDPVAMYDRTFGKQIQSIRRKLERSANGEPPPVAPLADDAVPSDPTK